MGVESQESEPESQESGVRACIKAALEDPAPHMNQESGVRARVRERVRAEVRAVVLK